MVQTNDAQIGSLVVDDEHGQIAWLHLIADRFTQFEYDKHLAVKWYVQGRDSPVIIDPRISFGAPAVNGIPTWVLKGRWGAGESIADIEEDFGLSKSEIVHGLTFERILEAAANTPRPFIYQITKNGRLAPITLPSS